MCDNYKMDVYSLPPEILLEIMSYLNYTDIKFMRLVSKKFNENVQYKFINNSVLKITPENMNAENILFLNDIQLKLKFKNIKFQEIAIFNSGQYLTNEFWGLFFGSLNYLSISNSELSDAQLTTLLDEIITLTEFRIELLNDFNELEVIAKVISKVKILHIKKRFPWQSNKILEDFELPTTESTIEELKIKTKRRFSPLLISRKSIELFKIAAKSLRKLHINYLIFNHDKTESNILSDFNQIHFKLESLKIRFDTTIDDATFAEFLQQLNGLVAFKLSWPVILKNHYKSIIQKNLPHLETLKIESRNSSRQNNTESDVLDLSGLNELKMLQINEQSVRIRALYLSPNAPTNLTVLSLNCFLYESVIENIATNLINLKKLILISYLAQFPSRYLPTIFKNLVNLQELAIRTNPNRNEYLDSNTNITIDIANLQKLRVVNFVGLNHCRGVPFWHLSTLPSLEIIGYYHCGKVSKNNVIDILDKCPQIKQIYLNDYVQLISRKDELEIKATRPFIDLQLRNATRYE